MMESPVPYLEWSRWDVISRIKPLMDSGFCWIRADGRIDYQREKADPDTQWIFVGSSRINCLVNHRIIRVHFRFIPSECLECWKVVAAPRTVAELFAVLDIMKAMGRPGKCGAEGDRINTDKLYGAYWYNNSLEEGLACYRSVRAEIDRDVSASLPVILKRGCTEFEQEFGPSDKWEIGDEQRKLENIIAEAVVGDVFDHHQRRHAEAAIKKRWLHNAYKWGDKTYLEFTGGEPLFKPVATYHDHKEKSDGKECS